MYNLRNRHFLKELDFSMGEAKDHTIKAVLVATLS